MAKEAGEGEPAGCFLMHFGTSEIYGAAALAAGVKEAILSGERGHVTQNVHSIARTFLRPETCNNYDFGSFDRPPAA